MEEACCKGSRGLTRQRQQNVGKTSMASGTHRCERKGNGGEALVGPVFIVCVRGRGAEG